jgi:hypothetical protein
MAAGWSLVTMRAEVCRSRSNFLPSSSSELEPYCKEPETRRFTAPGYRGRASGILVLVIFAAALVLTGCFGHKAAEAPAAPPASSDNPSPSAPEAKVNISYGHPGDYMNSLTVTKYSGANTLLTTPGSDGKTVSIVRFDGGVVVWDIAVDKSILTKIPLLGPSEEKPYALKEISYGVMPEHFTETVPESGPPEPLEPEHFYIFTVRRASGSVSYDAVKVNGDGSLEAYDADPRAGNSFKLCCNVSPAFTITAAPTAVDAGAQP